MAAELKVSKADRASIINEATDKVLARLAQLLGAPAAETEDDSDDAEEEDDTPAPKASKKSKKAAAESDDEEDEAEEDEEEDGESEDEDSSDDEEEDGDSEDSESDTLKSILAEMKAIPDKTIARAKKESAAAPKKEKLTELRDYLKARGASKTEIADATDELDDDELNGVYADYYSRFLDVKGEVHATDEPYDAIRIVKGKEKTVRCCNGVPMEDGVCAVNPKIKDKKAGKKAVVEDEDSEDEEVDEEADDSDDESEDEDSEDGDSEDEDAEEEEEEEEAPKKRGRPAVKKKGKK